MLPSSRLCNHRQQPPALALAAAKPPVAMCTPNHTVRTSRLSPSAAPYTHSNPQKLNNLGAQTRTCTAAGFQLLGPGAPSGCGVCHSSTSLHERLNGGRASAHTQRQRSRLVGGACRIDATATQPSQASHEGPARIAGASACTSLSGWRRSLACVKQHQAPTAQFARWRIARLASTTLAQVQARVWREAPSAVPPPVHVHPAQAVCGHQQPDVRGAGRCTCKQALQAWLQVVQLM